MSYVVVIKDGAAVERAKDGSFNRRENTFLAERQRHLYTTFFDVTQMKLANPVVVGNENDMVVVRDRDTKVDFFFHKTTGLLAKSVQSALPTSETLLTDYKDFDGGMVPTRITNWHGYRVIIDLTILDITFVDKWDESVFGRP
jgi:hypothetical protein